MDPKIITLGLKGLFAAVDHPYADKIMEPFGRKSQSGSSKKESPKPKSERKPKEEPPKDPRRELRSSRRSDSPRRSRSPKRDPATRYRPDRGYERDRKDVPKRQIDRYKRRETDGRDAVTSRKRSLDSRDRRSSPLPKNRTSTSQFVTTKGAFSLMYVDIPP
ncbi:hypothetical protein M409DRAFT_27585 [Zasmidium cellare ATCC 36951]|uniref:Uncharacterized protein n=1 Tax=Zasmidium cellare ATCC 36951 TaxID=1080233 RepID=A0A6A6C7H8_ZASCE|nr:uncharacterized protein M409DRAFT_27585 [Zasmidium cellare ATCC 36951]KAF2162208.1 hypothetical protein M409DRAFT_27585 [Zasmidium cellare ATCC 36951]